LFIKQIEPSFDHFDNAITLIGVEGGFTKSAAVDEQVKHFLDQYLRANKKPNHFYLHVNALGAGEYYGANRNGDFFPEENLLRYYKTFESGHLFRHHQNRNPDIATGKVLGSFYNERMHRVELIVEVPRELGSDIENRVQADDMPWTSMATKTPYDTCSICGNQASSRMEYCDHLSNHMNELLPDGRRVYANNDGPLRFFDISIVVKPADPTSGVLEKVAHSALPYTPLQGAEFRLKEVDSPLKQEAMNRAKEMLSTKETAPFDILYPPEDLLPMLRGCSVSELANLYADSGIHPPVDYTMRVLAPEMSPRLAELGASFLPMQNSWLGMGVPVPSVGFLKTSQEKLDYMIKSASYCSSNPGVLEKRAFEGMNTQEGYLPFFNQNPYAAPIFYPQPGGEQPMPVAPAAKAGILPTLIGMAGMALLINAFAHALAVHKDKEVESRIGMMMQAQQLKEQNQRLIKALRNPELRKSASYEQMMEALPLPPELKDAIRVAKDTHQVSDDAQQVNSALFKQALFGVGEDASVAAHAIGDNPVLRALSRPYSTTPPPAVSAMMGGADGSGQGFAFASKAHKDINPVTSELVSQH
jgi:hypothetical protein